MSNDVQALMHPARIRILTALAEREATPHEIAAAMPGIPKASLYRHLNILRAVGAIREVREYRVRGVYEKVYAVETETGPLAGFGHADGRPGACISEWLGRFAGADAPLDDRTPAPPPLSGEGAGGRGWTPAWERTEFLTTEEVAALQVAVDAWIDGRAPRKDATGTVRVTIRVGESGGTAGEERA